MKLFVWDDVLNDYTSGIIIAHARSVAAARKLILKQQQEDDGYESAAVISAIASEPKVYDTSKEAARIIWGGG